MKFIYPFPFFPIPDNFLQSNPLPSGSHLRSEQNGALKNSLAECVYANEMYDRMKFISREHTATQQKLPKITLPLISITLGTQTLTGYSFCLVSFFFFRSKSWQGRQAQKGFLQYFPFGYTESKEASGFDGIAAAVPFSSYFSF